MGSNKKQIAMGAVLSYANIGIGAIITLLYTPFMIRVLGQSEYGLYNTAASVISSLSILSLGFGSSYVRFFSRYKAEKKSEDIAKLNGMFIIVFGIIGVITFCCGIFLANNMNLVYDNGLTLGELKTARILVILLTISMALSFPASVFTSIITANEKFIFQKTILLVKQILSPVVGIPLLIMGYASIGMVISSVAVSAVADVFCVGFCFAKLNTRFNFMNFPKETFKEIATYSSFIAINMIVDQINLNIDKILLGRFCGTVSVAVYSAGYTLYNYYHSFSTSISNVFIPRIHYIWSSTELSTCEKNIKLSKLFAMVGRFQFIILWLVCSGLILFGKQFILIWAGEGYDNAYLVTLLLSISAIVPLSQNVGIEIQRAKNKHQFRSILYLFMAIINLVMSVYLCQIYGEIGSAIGTAVSFIVANTMIMNIFYYKVLEIEISKYWKGCIRVVISSIPAVVTGMIICRFINTSLFIPLIASIAIYTTVYGICILIFGLEKKERNLLVMKVKNKVL